MKKKICFILNPKAGHGIHERSRKAIADRFAAASWEVRIVSTQQPGHASTLSGEAARDGFDVVVAVGGDGTVNEVASALKNTDSALAIVPTGSGNGLARHFKIPLDMAGALDVVFHANTVRIDNLLVNGRFCLNLAGAGFDAYVAKLFAKGPRRGFYSYLKLVVKNYFHYKESDYRVSFDDMVINRKALLVAFANGSQFGNGARIALSADPGDGLLNLVILQKMSVFQIPAALLSLFSGNLAAQKFAGQYLTKKVQVTCNFPTDTHIDGEPTEPVSAWEVLVEPQTIRLLVP